jgi:hypothetical protein
MRLRLFAIFTVASSKYEYLKSDVHIYIIFLLIVSARLLSAISILGKRYILVFWAFFGSLLKLILNYFENNLG